MIRFSEKSVGTIDERNRISKLLESRSFFTGFRGLRERVITIHPPLVEPTEVKSVHVNWKPQYVEKIETPVSLPRKEVIYLCPEGARLVEVSCVEKQSGGMSSYYGFEGTFFSLVVSPDLNELIDARSERAT